MKKTKENKAKLQIIISAMILTVILIAEMFVLNEGVGTAIFSVIFGIIALIAVYVMVNAIMTISAEKEAQRQAHFDNLYKSEKASYIMLKNKFEEIEGKLAVLQENSKIPSEEIINAQKGIAKVIINRSKENADAIINSNDQVLERLDEMDETQNTKFTGISKDQRLKLTEMSNQTELKLQDMVVQLKDMELRLNQAIMQTGGAKVVVPAPENVSLMDDDDLFAPEPLIAEDEFAIEEELGLEDNLDIEETLNIEDSLDIEENLGFEEEAVFEEEPVVTAPGVDLSDPNKAMSADDIAALFASMNGADTEVEDEPEMEEPEVEDIPPMPDLSDPNKAMTPDEIAALIANL